MCQCRRAAAVILAAKVYYVERAAPEMDGRIIFEELCIINTTFGDEQTHVYVKTHDIQSVFAWSKHSIAGVTASRGIFRIVHVQSGMQCELYLLSPYRVWVFVKGVKLYPVGSCHLVSHGSVNISASTACSSFSSSGLSRGGSVSLPKTSIRVRTYTSSVP